MQIGYYIYLAALQQAAIIQMDTEKVLSLAKYFLLKNSSLTNKIGVIEHSVVSWEMLSC